MRGRPKITLAQRTAVDTKMEVQNTRVKDKNKSRLFDSLSLKVKSKLGLKTFCYLQELHIICFALPFYENYHVVCSFAANPLLLLIGTKNVKL